MLDFIDEPLVKLTELLGCWDVKHGKNEGSSNHKVYTARWTNLFLPCGVYFLTSWISFTIPTDEDTLTEYFGVHDGVLNYVLAYFLLGNSLGTLIEPCIEASWGMRKLVILTSSLLTVGCASCYFMRHIFFGERIGLVIVGLSQGIIQCPLAKLCASWFCANGRTKATTIALTMNNFGIGVAYILPGLYWDGLVGFGRLRVLHLCIAGSLLLATIVFFEEKPPIAPSLSAELMFKSELSREKPSSFTETLAMFRTYWWNSFCLFSVPGFFSIVSISIGDVMVSYLSTIYLTQTLQNDFTDSDLMRTLVGIGYYVPSVFVGAAAASLIDHFKVKRPTTTYMTSLHAGCLISILSCTMIVNALYEVRNGAEDSARNSFIIYMIILGNLMALLDGISADGVVEICYGCGLDGGMGVENMVLTLQQFLGNVLTAVLMISVPSALMNHGMSPHYMLAYVITTGMAVLMYLPLFSFKGKFRRVSLDLDYGGFEPAALQRLLKKDTDEHEATETDVIKNI